MLMCAYFECMFECRNENTYIKKFYLYNNTNNAAGLILSILGGGNSLIRNIEIYILHTLDL